MDCNIAIDKRIGSVDYPSTSCINLVNFGPPNLGCMEYNLMSTRPENTGVENDGPL